MMTGDGMINTVHLKDRRSDLSGGFMFGFIIEINLKTYTVHSKLIS